MSNPDESKPHTLREELKDELTRTRDDLHALADEIRLKVHLGGMDAKDAWNRLEPKVDRFGHRLEEITDEIGAELREAGSTLKDEMKALRDRLAGST